MKEKLFSVFAYQLSNIYSFRVFFVFSVLFFSVNLNAQDFTLITTGDIVNDGGWNYACCWADFNGDGYDDLFVCNNDANNGKHNFLYFNNNDGTFTKITEGDIITDGNSSYGCTAADYDNDGDIDLFVSNYNENNCLYNNNG
ncbi:MAG: VCBS repeat-containing protein, partial [Candidatus Cloacimonetes bacterium]|nr:VCBS repeat-containing protein [Candidatus Cloacimonadota bacterium]